MTDIIESTAEFKQRREWLAAFEKWKSWNSYVIYESEIYLAARQDAQGEIDALKAAFEETDRMLEKQEAVVDDRDKHIKKLQAENKRLKEQLNEVRRERGQEEIKEIER